MTSSERTRENEKIQSQIGVSISLARNLVAGWLPPMTEEEKRIEARNAKISTHVLQNRRKPGAGLGSSMEKDDSAQLSLEEIKIKRRLMQKDKKLKEHARENLMQKTAKKHGKRSSQRADNLSSDDDEETLVRQKGQKRSKTNISSLDAHASRGLKTVNRGFGR